MRTGCAIGAIVIATAACGSSSAAPQATSSPPSTTASAPASAPPGSAATAHCGPGSAKTLAANRRARVYSTSQGVYGCATPGTRSYLLAQNSLRPGQPRISKLALAGVMVAYGATTNGVDTAGAEVTVRRLDNGRTFRSLPAMTQPIGPESFQAVTSIVVRSNGAVAWIAVARSIIRHSTQGEVDRADHRGRATLDRGSGIDSTSLHLTGTVLTWRHAGATRTDRLF
jgi:hypothetical protein